MNKKNYCKICDTVLMVELTGKHSKNVPAITGRKICINCEPERAIRRAVNLTK